MTLGDKIRAAREAAGLTQEELGKKCGTTKQTIYKYEIGKITNIPLDRLEKIADIVGVTTTSLLGWQPEERPSTPLPSNILPMPEMRKIPLLGTISCGAPVLAEEHIEGQVDIPANIHADFALTCKGDSMINARIFDGDIVYIRQQDTVENGEIAAVLIETEATLKRFKRLPDRIILEPENPLYDPLVYRKEEMNEVRILGKAVAFTSSVR